MKAPFIDADGKQGSDVELAPEVFDVQVNVPVLHEVVRAQRAAARSGTHSTKTRGEVSGGGRKPWRQKGLGRARHGSIREPQWRGGGIAHGPKPRDYSIRVNRKIRTLALRSALTDRARAGKVIVVNLPGFDQPKTRRAIDLLERWGAVGRVLLVAGLEAERSADEASSNALLSFRNLTSVVAVTYPTAYNVLAADTVVFTKAALEELTTPASSAAPATSGGPAETAPPTESDVVEGETK